MKFWVVKTGMTIERKRFIPCSFSILDFSIHDAGIKTSKVPSLRAEASERGYGDLRSIRFNGPRSSSAMSRN
jgi:hypothetical protein